MKRGWQYGIALVAVVALASPADSAFQLRGHVEGNGGAVISGGGIILHSTVGQAAVGVTGGPGNIACLGYWCFGGVRVVSVDPPPGEEAQLPQRLEFGSPYPNPASGRVYFDLALPKGAEVQLAIYDVRGRRVSAAPVHALEAGWHRLEWGGEGSPRSGVYFARLRVDGKIEGERRLVILH